MLALNEIIDLLANSIRWYCHVLMRKDSHVLRRAFDFEDEGQKKKGRLKRTWMKQLKEEDGWFEQGRHTKPTKVECWC